MLGISGNSEWQPNGGRMNDKVEKYFGNVVPRFRELCGTCTCENEKSLRLVSRPRDVTSIHYLQSSAYSTQCSHCALIHTATQRSYESTRLCFHSASSLGQEFTLPAFSDFLLTSLSLLNSLLNPSAPFTTIITFQLLWTFSSLH